MLQNQPWQGQPGTHLGWRRPDEPDLYHPSKGDRPGQKTGEAFWPGPPEINKGCHKLIKVVTSRWRGREPALERGADWPPPPPYGRSAAPRPRWPSPAGDAQPPTQGSVTEPNGAGGSPPPMTDWRRPPDQFIPSQHRESDPLNVHLPTQTHRPNPGPSATPPTNLYHPSRGHLTPKNRAPPHTTEHPQTPHPGLNRATPTCLTLSFNFLF